MRKIRQNKGITLVALVITIIILLLLAGITISQLVDNNLFGKIKQAEKEYEIQADIETLKLEYQEYKIAMASNNTGENFLEYLEHKNYLVNYDTSEVTLNGRIYYIETEQNLNIKYVGKADKTVALLPSITNLKTTVNDNKATVEIELKDSTGVTVTYTLSKGEELVETSKTTDLFYIFSGLETGTTYIITVEVTNEYGTRIRKVSVKIISLLELTNGKAYFEINPSEGWQEKVTSKIVSEYSDSKSTLQYRIGQDGTWTDYTTEFEVNKNTTLYGRYYNKTTEEIGYAFTYKVQIIDETGPQISIKTEEIKGKSIKISVTAIDNGVGMPDTIEFKYYISTDGITYILKETSNTNTYVYEDLNISTKYYLKVSTKDKIENEGESIITPTTITPVLVTNIELDYKTLIVGVGQDKKLTATITPDNATDKNVSWKSSNELVAKVTDEGVVTGVALGNATITCTSKDGGASAICNITIENSAFVSGDGDDTEGDGSEEKPYRTINKAVSSVASNSTIHLKSGTYTIDRMYDRGKKITFVGENEKTYLIYKGNHAIRLSNSASIARNFILEYDTQVNSRNDGSLFYECYEKSLVSNVFFYINSSSSYPTSLNYGSGANWEFSCKNCVFTFATSYATSPTNAKYTNCVTSVTSAPRGTRTNLVTYNCGNDIESTKEVTSINNAKAGVYFGTYAWSK